MGDWLKKLAIGMLQDYIYGQKDDLLAWLFHLARKNGKDWGGPTAGLAVPTADLAKLAELFLKALAATLQHGKPPV